MQNIQLKSSIKAVHINSLILIFVMVISSGSSLWALGNSGPDIKHPMMSPKKFTSNMNCPNCGMMINMWARTRHTFTNSEGTHETCSIRCMSDLTQKSGDKAQNAKVAVYLMPEKMISVNEAFYVIGSAAKGTMTMKSKIAFDSKESAQKFVDQYGGEIMQYDNTLKIATMEVNKTREKIQENRMKKGKIASPSETVKCSNCGMYPARYPDNRSQMTTATGEHLHFCSTKCMVTNKKNSDKKIASAWATVYTEGDYEYAQALYYVVGSKVMGPMGPEAIPFRKKVAAIDFTKKEGGKVLQWAELTPEIIGGHMMMK